MLKQNRTLQDLIDNLPASPGVYLFRNQKRKTLYVGKANHLKNRVRSYFYQDLHLGPRTSSLVQKIHRVEYIRVESEIEALILEMDLIKRLKPYYNSQWKDDKRYQYIKIVNDKYPRFKKIEGNLWPQVTTSRKTDDPKASYFGPFPEGGTVREVLKTLRKIFPWCEYKNQDQLKRAQRVCLYYHLSQCPGICAGQIPLAEYWGIINQLKEFLLGKRKRIIGRYEQQMKKLSRQKKYEEASKIRDKIRKISYVTQNFRDPSAYLKTPNLIEDLRDEEINDLLKALYQDESLHLVHTKTTRKKFRIEAFDVSNLQGRFPTGSRVVFINGEPEKSEYRRYKIKRMGKIDDLEMMKEVLTRRFANQKEPRNLPDLILVDGGVGQLRIALSVLKEEKLQIPTIALAKRFEEIYLPANTQKNSSENLKKVSLPKAAPGIKLLQRIRDEAHRFAISYHRKLRSRSLI